MSRKLRRWTGPIAVVALILVTVAFTTLVNQVLLAPPESVATAPRVESSQDSAEAELESGAAEETSVTAKIATETPAPALGTPEAADTIAGSAETDFDSGPEGEEDYDDAGSGQDSGEAKLDLGAADSGHTHASDSESPEPARQLCVVAHEDPDKLYWRFVELHAGRAADLLGMRLDYSGHPDATERAQAISACASNGAPMILATLADPQIIVPTLRAAAEQGARIATFGAGAEFADDAGSTIHVAMDGSAAARRAADQFAAAGIAGAVLCLIPAEVEDVRRQICDELRISYAGGSVSAHQLTAPNPSGQIEQLLAAAPATAGVLVLEADLLPHAIEAMENSGIAPVLGSIGEYPLNKLPFAQRDQIAFTVMDLARFEVLLAAAALRLMHTYHPNARFFEGAMIFEGQPNVHTGGARGGHERSPSDSESGHGNDGHDHGHGNDGHDH